MLIELRGRGGSKASSGKVNTILINMERWRWLPHDLGPYYVTVNIPEFMLRVVEEGKVVHTTRVVVGKPDKQTPIFSQDMQEIVFNPIWNVPNSIKTEELLPYLSQEAACSAAAWDTSVLERHNLRVNLGGRDVDPAAVDWGRVDIRTLNIYQPPGPDNVLGNVKFVFPNKHDVYMHDTTQKVPVRPDRSRREPWLHAGAEPRSAGAVSAQAGSGLDARPRRFGHRRCRRPAREAEADRFPSTSPISPPG